MSDPFHPTFSNEREAVIDGLYRVLHAYDEGDVNLFETGWTSDAKFVLGTKVLDGYEAIRNQAVSHVFPKDTLHQVSNIRVDINQGGNAAKLMANGIATHALPGEGNIQGTEKFTSYCKYNGELVKDNSDGLWKIKTFSLKINLCLGDSSMMSQSH